MCLGESRDLVNDVTLLAENYYPESLPWLVRDENGFLTLPYWVDHVGSLKTRSLRYDLRESQISQPPDLSWTSVQTD